MHVTKHSNEYACTHLGAVADVGQQRKAGVRPAGRQRLKELAHGAIKRREGVTVAVW